MTFRAEDLVIETYRPGSVHTGMGTPLCWARAIHKPSGVWVRASGRSTRDAREAALRGLRTVC